MVNSRGALFAGVAIAALMIVPALAQGGGGGQGGGGQGAGQGGGDLLQDRDMDRDRDMDKDMDKDMDRDMDKDMDRDQDRDRLYLGTQDKLRDHDRDRDGSLSEAEFRAWHESAFDAFDSDKSGGFNLQEYKAVRLGPGPNKASATNQERAELRKTERFRLMDGDGDGVVTRSEYMNFGELNYLDADANDDGKLKFKELQKYHRNM